MNLGSFPMDRLVPAILAMGVTILASNLLVEHPVQVVLAGVGMANWVTYGAITYPIAFLVTDTTNRLYGKNAARIVVVFGFAFGVILSLILADMRIALASGTAFFVAQMLDVAIFDKLRRQTWWKAPLISSLFGSAVDTALFFSIAFFATGLPWVTWAMGDFAIKLTMAALLLPAFRGLMAVIPSSGSKGEASV